jgi:hypothetical protein
MFIQRPILIPLDWTKEFHIHTDASGITIGVVLTQQRENKVDFSIYYASKLLNQIERIYTVAKREALSMIYTMKKIRHCLLIANHFIFLCGSPNLGLHGE